MSTLPSTTWTASEPSARPLRIDGAGGLRDGLPWIALAATFALLAIRSWGTWPDPLIDFGRELYVPWRMAEGDVLYRDIAYFNGPLSPAVNAALFRWFGASLSTLAAANFVWLALLIAALHRAVRAIAGRRAAKAGVATFLLLFAFSQFLPVRNYNYVCPYSHEMTHGLLLSVLGMLAIWRTPAASLAAPLAAGVLLGLVSLTKVEVTIAAAAGVFVSAILLSLADAKPRQALARSTALLACGAALPPAIAIVWLSRWMPTTEAAGHCLAAWEMAASSEIRQLDFYRRGMGTYELSSSLSAIAVSSSRWAVFIVVSVWASRLAPSGRNRCLLVVIGIVAAWTLWHSQFHWPAMERALPVLLVGLVVWRAGYYLAGRGDSPEPQAKRRGIAHDLTGSYEVRRVEACRLGWCIFSLVLLAKMLLNSRVAHYGFVLAVPATMTVVSLLYDWLPRAVAARRKWGGAIAWLATPLLIAYAAAYQVEQHRLRATERTLSGSEDHFRVGENAAPVIAALERIERRIGPDETLAVLPEGVMLNYLARRRTSVPYVTWMPPEVLHFGESAMLAELELAPPDWVIIADRDLAEYGVPPFGAGFADSIAHWIGGNYRVVETWDDGRWRLLRRARLGSAVNSKLALKPSD